MAVSTSRIRGRYSMATLGLAPALIVVFGLLVIPLMTLMRYSFNRYSPSELMVEAVTLENYARFFSDPYYQKVMFTTLSISLSCTLVSLILGYPMAYFLARTKSRFKSLIVIAILFPLLVGNVVRAAGWMSFLGREGFLNVTLLKLGVVDAPVELMFTSGAVFVGLLGVLLPFMILTLQSVLEGMDFTLLDAANNLGARPARAFFHVILPMSIPGIVGGSILVFTLAMNSYATPLLLGGPEFQMMALTLYGQIAIALNWPFGAALAFILVAVTFAVTILATSLLARQYKSQ